MSLITTLQGLPGDLSGGLGFALGAGESAISPTPPTGTSGAGMPTGWALAIAQAASKFGIPIQILLGVFGIETSFGSNITTSSAGAIGPFQFLPSTASQYGYPLTNTPTSAQFAQQADAAAQYLSALYKQTGNWNTALEHYSGGGYGLAQVNATATKAPSQYQSLLNTTGFTSTALNAPAQAASSATSGVAGAITGVFNTLVGDAKYALVLLVIVVLAGVMIFRGVGGGGGGSSNLRGVPIPE